MIRNLMSQSTAKVLGRQILIVGLLLVLTSSAAAQSRALTDGTTPTGIAPGSPAGSFALSDFDTINPYNGNLNLAIPLLRIGGRGSAGYTMTLPIDQRWTVRHQYDEVSSWTHYPEPAWWRPYTGYSPGLVVGRTVGEGSCSSGGGVMSSSLTRLTFAAPDGTEIELIDKLTWGNISSIYCYGGGTGPSRGSVFVSYDGSYMTFISDTTIHDIITTQYTFYPSGYLLFKDGTRYRVDNGRISWIRDTNGNKVTLEYQFGKVIKVTDSLNREVTIAHNVSDPQYGNHDQITYKGFGGQSRTIRVGYQLLDQTLRADQSIKTFWELFGLHGGSGGQQFIPSTTSSVWLPDGRRYRIYYNSYAEVARVELPTGGAFEYDWGATMLNAGSSGVVSVNNGQDWLPEIYRRVLTKRIYSNGGSGNGFETRITFGQTQGQGTATCSNELATYDSAGQLLALQKHYFHGNPIPSYTWMFQYNFWSDGKEYQTELFDIVGGNPVLVSRTNNTWVFSGGMDGSATISETVTTLIETNQVSRKTFSYDQFHNLTDTYEYDFGSGSAGPLVRHSHTDYLVVNEVNGIDYTREDVGIHQRNLPLQQQVFDGSGIEKSQVVYEYDNYTDDAFHAALMDRPGLSGHDWAFTTAYTARGNVTAITNYLLGAPTIGISAYAQYDIAGNRVKSIDARSTPTNIIATIFEYDDRFGAPDGEARSNSPPAELAGLTTYAFPSKMINALGHEAFVQADYYLGATVDSEDLNGIVASAYFNDLLGRPSQVKQAVGTSAARQVTITYDDANRTITTTTDLNSNGEVLKSQTLYDGLGRTTETREYEGGSNFIAVRQIPFLVEQDGSNWRMAAKTSNAFRPYVGEQPIWTTRISDSLGRVIKLSTADNAAIITAFSGDRSLVADQAGKKRIARTDALGRMTDMWEVTPTDSATEAISFPGFADVTAGYRTSYIYDTLDNLLTVNQGSQTRTFVYDSLKRLVSATNPESGTVCYGVVISGQCQNNGYDNNGNLILKTDARGVVTNYVYDALNRLTSRTYNDATPAVSYVYDTLVQNGKGRLTSVSSSVSTYSYSGYDAMGRALGATQTIGAQSYTMGYGYNLAGAVTLMTYPSGRTVTNTFDGAGRLSSFAGNLGGSQRTYASGISYSPFGGMKWEQYGTDTPLYHKTFYNIRGQMFDTRVSSVNDTWDWNRGRLILYYSGNHQWGGSGTDNNGNVRFMEHWIPPPNATLDQAQYLIEHTYAYDSLNRISSVGESTLDIAGGGSWTPRFVQAYSYDRYGNRTINAGATWGTGINNRQFTVDTNNNRLGVPNGQSGSMSYDSAGNLTADTYSGTAVTRVYDAENRMTSETTYNSVVSGSYSYDGDGRRVKRIVNGIETWQVYGLGGELLAEYAANAPASSPQKEYGYRNGELLITTETGTTSAAAPSSLVATPPTSGASITLNWSAASGATNYRVERRDTSGSYSLVGTTSSTSLIDTTGTNGSAYLYKVCAANGSGNCTSGFSNVALGAAVTFLTDPTIESYSENPANATSPKAAHINELRTAVNAVRSLAGLPTITVPNPSVGDLISVNDVRDLRTNLGEALTQLGIQLPTYTDSTLKGFIEDPLNATTIKAAHIRELRQAATNGLGGSGGGGSSFRINWLVADQLGTPRMIFDQSGSLANVGRHDYLPFGEELFGGPPSNPGVGGRLTTQGYTASDGVRQKFTGYEHDDETGLDFAEARYFSSTQGRFLSPDPLIASARRQTPQSWNRYSYVIGNPLTYVDPSGEAWIRGPRGVIFFDKDIHTAKELRKAYGRGYEIIDGRQGVIKSTFPGSGFIVGNLYTFHSDGNVTNHGVYTPRTSTPRLSTQYGDEMALAIIKLYVSAAVAGATGGTGVLAITLGSAGVASDFLLPEDATDSQTAMMAAGTTVYVSYSPDGKPEYIGISDDFERRAAEHARSGRTIEKVRGMENLTREQAKAVEQALIERYGFRRAGGSLSNIRNSVSPRRAEYKAALRRGLQILRRAKLR